MQKKKNLLRKKKKILWKKPKSFNISQLYYITNLEFQHKPKTSSFKNPRTRRRIEVLLRKGQSPLKLLYSIVNLNTHILCLLPRQVVPTAHHQRERNYAKPSCASQSGAGNCARGWPSSSNLQKLQTNLRGKSVPQFYKPIAFFGEVRI